MLLTSFILVILGYSILCYGTAYKDAVQPISATILWLVLDTLAARTAYESGASVMLPLGYVVGCVATIIITLWVKKAAFAKSDLWIAVMVGVCICVWLGIGSLAGLIASSLAVFIAGVPLLFHYAKFPEEGQISTWLIFTAANIAGLVGGLSNGNELENWIFPVCALTGSLLTVSFIARKWLK